MTSPSVFRDYSRRHLTRFAEIAHAGGKTALAHMCGHIRDMLPHIRGTGLDGLNYVTPPPLGDTPLSEVFRVLGDDFIVDAAVNPTVWMSPPALDEVRRNAAALVTEDLLDKNLVFTAGADGIPGIPVERFEAVAEALRPFTF
jgi:uroporphyrinogen-III decarboxylase